MAIKVIKKSKIKTKPIFIKLNDPISADILVQSLDYVPFLFLSKLSETDTTNSEIGTTIDPNDIIYVKLYNSKFLPQIELYCDDSKGILFNDLYPFDHDTLLSIFIKSYTESVLPIRMDFRVTEYKTIKSDIYSETFKYLIKGILNVDDLHYTRYEAKKGTSYKVLSDLAEQINLGWATNISDSDDEMKWINPGNNYFEFIKDITKHSFVNKDSFVWTFIDFYYNLNYIEIQKELNEFIISKHSVKNTQIIKNDKEKDVDLYLTNNKLFNSTNQYISKFDLVNQSFKVNLDKGYKMKATWYDKNDNTIFRKYLKNLVSDKTGLKHLFDKNSIVYCENTNLQYEGKIDIDNMHKNYHFAKMSNDFNLENLQKMKMIVILNTINFSIKRFQNILVEIYNPDDMFSKAANVDIPLNNINKKLSGYWLVTGINYLYRRNGGVEQEITLIRRDLSTNYGEESDEKHDLRKIIK